MAHMMELRQKGLTPVGLRDYVVERVKVGDKMVILRSSLTPWGGYHVYALGQVAGADGQISFRVALESGDFDQPAFAQEHPSGRPALWSCAARGPRRARRCPWPA